jgi:hypothetical protein
MANKVITMQQIRSIIQLLEKGYSLRSISAQIGLSRQPVTFYAARLRNAAYSLEALRQFSDEDLAAIVYAPSVTTSLSALAQVSRPVRERYFPTSLLVCRRNILQLINIKQEISKDSAAALLI